MIDTYTVVRLKDGLKPGYDRKDWGTRTDYLCARSPRYDKGNFDFWLAMDRYAEYESSKKPTTGLCAVLEVFQRLQPTEVALIGFDRLLRPNDPDPPFTWLAHDKHAEHRLLMKLGVKELHG